jgi:hypothetical protein
VTLTGGGGGGFFFKSIRLPVLSLLSLPLSFSSFALSTFELDLCLSLSFSLPSEPFCFSFLGDRSFFFWVIDLSLSFPYGDCFPFVD